MAEGGTDLTLLNGDTGDRRSTFTGVNADIGRRLRAVEYSPGEDNVSLTDHVDGRDDLREAGNKIVERKAAND